MLWWDVISTNHAEASTRRHRMSSDRFFISLVIRAIATSVLFCSSSIMFRENLLHICPRLVQGGVTSVGLLWLCLSCDSATALFSFFERFKTVRSGMTAKFISASARFVV